MEKYFKTVGAGDGGTYVVDTAWMQQRIAELEEALRSIVDLEDPKEPTAYSWGLTLFRRAHTIASSALEK